MNDNKYISISLFRVSSDSKYLDMIFSCPVEYYFDSLQLEVRYFDPSDKIMKSKYFDLSTALFNTDSEDPDNTISKKHWTVRLPLEKIGINVPAIYKGTIKANEIILEGTPEELHDYMICSDVNIAYKCMLSDLLNLDNSCSCTQISDEVIRKYLLLYGHQSALSIGDDEAAERFFKLIVNCFDLCGKSCGCGCRKQTQKSQTSCNCEK